MSDNHAPTTEIESLSPEIEFEGTMFARVRDTADDMSFAHMRFVEHCARLTVLVAGQWNTGPEGARGIAGEIRLALEVLEEAIENHCHAVRDEKLFQFRHESGTPS